jgi:hypothetical protein
MAAITMNTAAIQVAPPYRNLQFLESVTVTNGSGMGGDSITKGLYVPEWATKVLFYIFYDSAAGTSPLFDFTLGVPDWGTVGSVTDGTDVSTLGNDAWNGITQVTGTGAYQIVVEVGPDVATDDTGAAAASCWYKVNAELPPVITYTATIDTTTNDEDYAFRIVAQWK